MTGATAVQPGIEQDASYDLPATVSGLRALLAEAIRTGVILGDEDRGRDALADAGTTVLARSRNALPEFLHPSSEYQALTSAAVHAAVTLGWRCRRGLEKAEAGERLSRDCPPDFAGATLPPDPVWLAGHADYLIRSFIAACHVAALDPPEADVDDGSGMPAAIYASRSRLPAGRRYLSTFIAGELRGRLYQVIVDVTPDGTVAVSRRECGQEAETPADGTLRPAELPFLAQILADVAGGTG